LQSPRSALIFAITAGLLLGCTSLSFSYAVTPAAAVEDKGKGNDGSSSGGMVPVSTTGIANTKSNTSCNSGESRNADNQCVFTGPCPSNTITMRHNFDKTGKCFRK